MMNSRRASIVAGTLFIAGTIAGYFSMVPAVDATDFLTQIPKNEQSLIIGALFQFIMAFAYVSVAFVLYPILKNYSEELSIGFLGFRIIAGVFNIIGVVLLLTILSISQAHQRADSEHITQYGSIAEILRLSRDSINHVAMIISVSIGGILYFLVLLKSRLVPIWLSTWGLIGSVLAILASTLYMFQSIEILTTIYMVLNIPMALQELVLAIFLIVKGFNKSTLQSKGIYQ